MIGAHPWADRAFVKAMVRSADVEAMNLGWRAYITGFSMTLGLIALGAALEPHVSMAEPPAAPLPRPPIALPEPNAGAAGPSGLRVGSVFPLPAMESNAASGLATADSIAHDAVLESPVLEMMLQLSAGGRDPGLVLTDWQAIRPAPEVTTAALDPVDEDLATLPRPFTMRQWRQAVARCGIEGADLDRAAAVMDDFDRRWAEFSVHELDELRELRAHIDLARMQNIEPSPRTWLRLRELWERQPKVQEYQLAIWRDLSAEQRRTLQAELDRQAVEHQRRRDGRSGDGGAARPPDARVELRRGH